MGGDIAAGGRVALHRMRATVRSAGIIAACAALGAFSRTSREDDADAITIEIAVPSLTVEVSEPLIELEPRRRTYASAPKPRDPAREAAAIAKRERRAAKRLREA